VPSGRICHAIRRKVCDSGNRVVVDRFAFQLVGAIMKRRSLEDAAQQVAKKKPKIDAAALKAKLASTMSKVQKLRETTKAGMQSR
jgi:hypothetical protein